MNRTELDGQAVNGRRGAEPTPAVRLVKLRRTFGRAVAVEELDLDLADGEFFSIIGPSGCGKTTTLRMIAGLVDPTSGRIEVHGRDVTSLRAHRRPTNTVFQHYALFPHLSVFENVAFGLRERRVGRRELEERVAEVLDLVDLSTRASARPAELSGGQQQRVALARSLVLRPEVLLLDEPLGALDLKLRRALQLQLKRVQREVGITFVYVTHDQEEAFFMSDRVAIMNEGRIEQLGAPRDIYERPNTEFVADFVGVSNRVPGRVVGRTAGGSWEADLDGIGRVVAAGVDALSPGDTVTAIVRPEAITLSPPRTGNVVASARVTDVAYLGGHISYVLDIGQGMQLTMTANSGESASMLAVDDGCEVGWPPAATWLLPRAG
jgi:spermidine/putrescine transport system ATP-binding protein